WFGQGGYFSNAISYQKKFGMAKVWLAYSPEESHPQDALSNAGHAGAKGDLMASLVFNIPNGQVGVAYAKDNNATGTTGPAGEKNTKVFGKYSFGTSTVLAQYEQSKSDVATDYKVYFVGYQLKLPSMNKLAVQLGQTKLDSGANPKTGYAAIGMFHNFSKKTSIFAVYRKTSPDGANDQKAFSVGLREKF
ncbi:MAG: porin, partial [Gammaproteobacteria bacterium]